VCSMKLALCSSSSCQRWSCCQLFDWQMYYQLYWQTQQLQHSCRRVVCTVWRFSLGWRWLWVLLSAPVWQSHDARGSRADGVARDSIRKQFWHAIVGTHLAGFCKPFCVAACWRGCVLCVFCWYNNPGAQSMTGTCVQGIQQQLPLMKRHSPELYVHILSPTLQHLQFLR
jgi:hypothetical protein